MADIMPDPLEEAAAWHIAMPTMDVVRWHAFTDWLEADPAHAAAYDAVTRADRQLGAVPAPHPSFAANDQEEEHVRAPAWRRAGPRFWVGGALAASLAGLLVVGVGSRDAGRYDVATPAGTMKTIAMADGSAITMNGATRVGFDPAALRAVEVKQGEALFSVRHDAQHPFTVTAGRFQLVDLGTVFDILREKGRLSVSVSQGSVLFDPDGVRLTLVAGDSVTVDEAHGTLTRGKAGEVGGWRQGEMEFSGATLADVIAAIHRRTGADISASGPLSRQPFTGNIKVSGEASRDARHLAALVGADLHREGEKWVLSSAAPD